jgi:hypothetical protein
MSFTLVFLIAAFAALVVISGATFLLKGLKAALIAAGAMLLIAAVGFVVLVNVITAAM